MRKLLITLLITSFLSSTFIGIGICKEVKVKYLDRPNNKIIVTKSVRY